MKYIIKLLDVQVDLTKYNTLSAHIVSWNGVYSYRIQNLWWIIEGEGEWWGFGGLAILDKNVLYLGPTEILEKYRNRGLQKELIKIREQWAVENGYNIIRSSTDRDNLISANNLIKCGYKLIKPWHTADADGLYFEKSL